MIHTDTMELIIKNQQEQIKGLLETNRTLVESNQKLMEQTGELQQKVQELLSQVAKVSNKASWLGSKDASFSLFLPKSCLFNQATCDRSSCTFCCSSPVCSISF